MNLLPLQQQRDSFAIHPGTQFNSIIPLRTDQLVKLDSPLKHQLVDSSRGTVKGFFAWNLTEDNMRIGFGCRHQGETPLTAKGRALVGISPTRSAVSRKDDHHWQHRSGQLEQTSKFNSAGLQQW